MPLWGLSSLIQSDQKQHTLGVAEAGGDAVLGVGTVPVLVLVLVVVVVTVLVGDVG